MKKLLLYLLFFGLVLISFNTNVFGNEEECSKCKIHDGTPDIINDYIRDLRIVIGNITTQINEAENDPNLAQKIGGGILSFQDTRRIFTNLVRGINRSFDFRGYISYFNFYVTYPLLRGETAIEVWRDYNLLKREKEGLDKYYLGMSEKASILSKVDIEKICDGVNYIDTCNLGDQLFWIDNTIQSFMINLIVNHNAIMDYFRRSILYDNPYAVLNNPILKDLRLLNRNETFLLMPKNFKAEFRKYYNGSTNIDCIKCSGGFQQKIEKAFNDMEKRLDKGMEEAIDEWIEATKLLMGNHENQSEIEKELLKKELANQGVDTKKANEMADNLGKPTSENNFFKNSFNNIKNNLVSEKQRWDKYYEQEFGGGFAMIDHIGEGFENIGEQVQKEIDCYDFGEDSTVFTRAINRMTRTTANNFRRLFKQEIPCATDEQIESIIKNTPGIIDDDDNFTDSIEVLEIQNNISNIQKSSSISIRINTLYNINLNKTQTSSRHIPILEERLNTMYKNIDKITFDIDNVIQTAVDVCNSQGVGLGVCDYR